MINGKGAQAPHMRPIAWIERLSLPKLFVLTVVCSTTTYVILSQLI